MQDKDPTSTARRRELHEAIVIEAGAMYAALDRQIVTGGAGDAVAAAVQERRFVRAQVVLADLCGSLSVYYREGSSTHLVASLAAAALGWAAWRHPELVGEIRAELAQAATDAAELCRDAGHFELYPDTSAELTGAHVNAHRSPAVVTNVSDLTPAMREALLHERPGRALLQTVQALVDRGLIHLGDEHYELTDAGQRARAALESSVGGAR